MGVTGKSVKGLTEFLFFLEEGTVEGVGGGVVEELEAVEDLDRPSPLNADDTAEDPGRRRGGRFGAVLRGLGLRLDPSVVVGDVEYY